MEVWILKLPRQPCSPVVFPPLPHLRICCVCRCKCSRGVLSVLKGVSPIQLHFGNPVCLHSGMGCVFWLVRSSLQLQLLWLTVVLCIALYLHSWCPSTARQHGLAVSLGQTMLVTLADGISIEATETCVVLLVFCSDSGCAV